MCCAACTCCVAFSPIHAHCALACVHTRAAHSFVLCTCALAVRHVCCRVERDALAGELRDLADQMAGEAAARGALQDELAAAQRQLGELRNELDVARSVRRAARRPCAYVVLRR